MKFGAIIQARTGSTRLPDKVIRNFYKDKTILEIIIENIKDNFDGEIILATTNSSKDDTIIDICRKEKIKFFRGSEDDVLDRFIKAASEHNLDVIARVCADNPLLQADSIKIFFDNMGEKNDYFAYRLDNGLPAIKSHLGLWPEAVRYDALVKAASLTKEKLYHEHVTNYIYENADTFNVRLINAPELLFKRHDIRLTVDTIADFELMQELYAELDHKNDFGIEAIFSALNKHPHYLDKMETQININKK
jgi:spore coat polysaccharide biosynthesis protein SpsF